MNYSTYINRMCQDCGHDTRAMGEYYMLRDRIWLEATEEDYAFMLCIKCVEARLGRTLTWHDFKQGVPINEGYFPRSLLMRKRLATYI